MGSLVPSRPALPRWSGFRRPRLHMAILDAALKDGPCREIALELSRRGVPFLIYSGHHEDRQLLAEFPHVTWIEKPVPSSVLVEACQQLLVGGRLNYPGEISFA